MRTQTEIAGLVAILLATFALRLVKLDQPIVENYVGRQIPTAMVARNLDRGSGFLNPMLDTGPFPNLFVVEPPIYAAAVVAARHVTGLSIAPSGRLISALATVLAAWAFYGMVRKRESAAVALASIAVFGSLPLTIRYGRAVQPDMLMLALILLALRLLDRHPRNGESRRVNRLLWDVLTWCALATGLAVKILAAWVFVPAFVLIRGDHSWPRRLLIAAAILPAIAWYLHAARLLATSHGSLASVDNGVVWLQVLIPSALLRLETYETVGRFLFWRSFTPAWPLAAWGFWAVCNDRRFWWSWAIAASAALLVLAAKLHHEYYLLSVAPLVALGFGKAVDRIRARWGPTAAVSVGVVLLVLSYFATRSTWETPQEWTGIVEAGREIQRLVPEKDLLVATEALLYMSDRRGCRLEFSKRSVERAAGEWGQMKVDRPESLVEFYRQRGARYVADLAFADEPSDRAALHAWIRRTARVKVDRPGLLLAEWNEGYGGSDAQK